MPYEFNAEQHHPSAEGEMGNSLNASDRRAARLAMSRPRRSSLVGRVAANVDDLGEGAPGAQSMEDPLDYIRARKFIDEHVRQRKLEEERARQAFDYFQDPADVPPPSSEPRGTTAVTHWEAKAVAVDAGGSAIDDCVDPALPPEKHHH